MPVIYAASGNCHVYVDASADLDRREAIVLNAKTQRPGVCNAAETLLVHERVAPTFLPRAAGALARRRRASCAPTSALLRAAPATRAASSGSCEAAERGGLGDRVPGADARRRASSTRSSEAIEHIARYGSGHSEAIVTRDTAAARAFQLGVDAACVYVNASTRFTDGGEFGMGAEIGNSTQKLHARGPIGLRELCTFKYLVEGDGHVRD